MLRVTRSAWRCFALMLIVLGSVVGLSSPRLLSASTAPLSLITTIPFGTSDGAEGIGINPNTNRIYVANRNIDKVSVIDGVNNTVITKIPVATNPKGIDVNPLTNIIYVANSVGNSLSVINGDTNNVITNIPLLNSPESVAVNPLTDKVYVGDIASPQVIVIIDAKTNQVKAGIPFAGEQSDIAINQTTNRIYVTSYQNNAVAVVDGSRDSIIKTISVSSSPLAVSVNATTNLVYVANWAAQEVTVIDGATNNIVTTIPMGGYVLDVEVNQPSNLIYATVQGSASDYVSVIDGTNNSVIYNFPNTDPISSKIGYNPVTSRVYISSRDKSNIKILQSNDVFDITNVSPVQVAENTDLVVNKPLAVKVTVSGHTAQTTDNIHATLRYNANRNVLNSFYQVSADNFDSTFALKTASDHLTFGSGLPTQQDIYFISNDLRPTTTGTYSVEVSLFYPGGAEFLTKNYNVVPGWTHTERVLFYPIKGDVANRTSKISQTLSYLNAIYPVAPGLIQTSPIRPNPLPDSSIPSPQYIFNLPRLLKSLVLAGHLADPLATRVVGVAPLGSNLSSSFSCILPGALCSSWTGVANKSDNYAVLVDDTTNISDFQQEVAHELGHTWGHPDHDGAIGPGPTARTVPDGLRVDLIQRMVDKDKKDNLTHRVYNAMCCRPLLPPQSLLEGWFPKGTYERFLAAPGHTNQLALVNSNTSKNKSIVVSGTIFPNGNVQLDPWYSIDAAPVDLPIGTGEYSVEIRDVSDSVLFSSSFYTSFTQGDPEIVLQSASFGFSIPYLPNLNKIVILHNGIIAASRAISPHEPSTVITYPSPNSIVGSNEAIKWSATDSDNDLLVYSVLVSSDNGSTWMPAIINTTVNNIEIWRLGLQSRQYFVKIITTDGINTTSTISGPFNILQRIFLPLSKLDRK